MDNLQQQRYRMKALAFFCAASLTFLNGCQQQGEPQVFGHEVREMKVPVGDGRPVMTDGIFQPEEWNDASTLVVNDSVSLQFKQYRGHFYIALDSRRLLAPTIDLYLSSDSLHIHQLHVSAQLAEQLLLVDPEGPIDTVWVPGRTSDWYANEFRWIYRSQDSLVNIEGMSWGEAILQTCFPHEAIEIDVLQSKIGGGPWFFRIAVWTARTDDQPLAFPPGTTSYNLENWATFVMQ
jgi:hypothetical protein